MDTPSVLIGSPTRSSKKYAFSRWLAAINRLNYPRYAVLVVDNSDDEHFYNLRRWKVPMVHLPLPNESPDRRIALSMEYIRRAFLKTKMDFWLNIEADIIVSRNIIELMLNAANGVDLVAAPYPSRREEGKWIDGCFGCTLFSRNIAKESFADAPPDRHTDMWFREKVSGKYRLYDLPRGLIKLDHLKE